MCERSAADLGIKRVRCRAIDSVTVGTLKCVLGNGLRTTRRRKRPLSIKLLISFSCSSTGTCLPLLVSFSCQNAHAPSPRCASRVNLARVHPQISQRVFSPKKTSSRFTKQLFRDHKARVSEELQEKSIKLKRHRDGRGIHGQNRTGPGGEEFKTCDTRRIVSAARSWRRRGGGIKQLTRAVLQGMSVTVATPGIAKQAGPFITIQNKHTRRLH